MGTPHRHRRFCRIFYKCISLDTPLATTHLTSPGIRFATSALNSSESRFLFRADQKLSLSLRGVSSAGGVAHLMFSFRGRVIDRWVNIIQMGGRPSCYYSSTNTNTIFFARLAAVCVNAVICCPFMNCFNSRTRITSKSYEERTMSCIIITLQPTTSE